MVVTTKDHTLSYAFAWADIVLEAADGRILGAEGALKPLLGRDKRSVVGRPLAELFVPGNKPLIDKIGDLLTRHGRVGEVEVQVAGPGGIHIGARLCGHALSDDGHQFLALRTDMRLPGDESCPRDRDSGLYAGESFHELAAIRLKQLTKGGRQVDLAVLDVDGLERISASLPDDQRETLLTAIGTLVKANSVDGDTAAALTGGKFGFLADSTQDMGGLSREVEDLVAAMAPDQSVTVSGARLAVGNAAGIDEDSLAKGLMHTFQAVQAAGGAKLRDLAQNMTSLVDRTVAQFAAFNDLLTHRKFDVALHPIVGLRDGKIHHFEALCRFHGAGKDASPFKIITFAEETGMIHRFDLAMATKVVDWLSHQPRNNDAYRAAVNVSGFSIGHPEYIEGLTRLLAANKWLGNRLIFEITESSRMSDLESANASIQLLRDRGFEVCLDDFGAGAASFQYLSVLDVDVVKLDGSAVKNAQRVPKGRAFLSALTDLCRKLNVLTVAEMVDSLDALEFVRECGCDFAQGYLFGKPSTDVRSFFPLPNQTMLAGRRGFK